MSPNNTVPCWIDGKPYTAASSIRVLDPHDPSKQLWDASCVSTEDADKAIASAWKAYATWSKTTHAERRAIFLRLANILREKTPQIVETEVSECTSTAGWATACLNVSIGQCAHFSGLGLGGV
jgi:acyl-CoA reductase-like NAD-dependent aldehyde dehydrogenase